MRSTESTAPRITPGLPAILRQLRLHLASAQFVIQFDDELALELGANGSIATCSSTQTGSKSIPGPGIGNYVTMGKHSA